MLNRRTIIFPAMLLVSIMIILIGCCDNNLEPTNTKTSGNISKECDTNGIDGRVFYGFGKMYLEAERENVLKTDSSAKTLEIYASVDLLANCVLFKGCSQIQNSKIQLYESLSKEEKKILIRKVKLFLKTMSSTAIEFDIDDDWIIENKDFLMETVVKWDPK